MIRQRRGTMIGLVMAVFAATSGCGHDQPGGDFVFAPEVRAHLSGSPVVHLLVGRAGVSGLFATSSLSVQARGYDSGGSPDRWMWVSEVVDEGSATGSYSFVGGVTVECELDGWFYQPNWAAELVWIGRGTVTLSGATFAAPCSIRTGVSAGNQYVVVEWKHVYFGGGTGGRVEKGHLASR